MRILKDYVTGIGCHSGQKQTGSERHKRKNDVFAIQKETSRWEKKQKMGTKISKKD